MIRYYRNPTGEQDEYHIIVFLNDETPSSETESRTDKGGVRIFTNEFTACLHHHGVSKSPNVHRDFLSAMGSLEVGEVVEEDCNDFYSEVVPRESNRLIVLSPKETFRFENFVDSFSREHSRIQNNKSFVKSAQLALVYVFA